jgi:hypothetical protein
MFRMTLTQEGFVEVDRMLDGMAGRMTDVSPAWPRVVEAFQSDRRACVRHRGRVDRRTVGAARSRTQMERARLGYPPAHPILQRRGTLARALTTGEGAYVRSGPTSLEYLLSGEVGYFKYHQSRAPRSRLPRRAPVLLTGDDKNAIVFPIRLYITGRDLNAPRRQAVG